MSLRSHDMLKGSKGLRVLLVLGSTALLFVLLCDFGAELPSPQIRAGSDAVELQSVWGADLKPKEGMELSGRGGGFAGLGVAGYPQFFASAPELQATSEGPQWQMLVTDPGADSTTDATEPLSPEDEAAAEDAEEAAAEDAETEGAEEGVNLDPKNFKVDYDEKTGKVSIYNRETGAKTVVDTESGEVRHEQAYDDTPIPDFDAEAKAKAIRKKVKKDPYLRDALVRRGVKLDHLGYPINSGDPHSYYPYWKHSIATTRGGMASVAESPKSATFRRHLANFWRYLGQEQESWIDAANRIYAKYPDPNHPPMAVEEEQEEAAEDPEGAEPTVEEQPAESQS